MELLNSYRCDPAASFSISRKAKSFLRAKLSWDRNRFWASENSEDGSAVNNLMTGRSISKLSSSVSVSSFMLLLFSSVPNESLDLALTIRCISCHSSLQRKIQFGLDCVKIDLNYVIPRLHKCSKFYHFEFGVWENVICGSLIYWHWENLWTSPNENKFWHERFKDRNRKLKFVVKFLVKDLKRMRN